MSQRSITSTVTVAIDPDDAFRVFTEEIACWWRQGPINFYDSTRAYELRIEPGVGGRVLELYDPANGDGLELARITAWEPGKLVAWTSSLDDVATEIRFVPAGTGTTVEVVATIPEGGVDAGGTSWVRVTPPWFARWVSRRDRVAHDPDVPARLAVAIRYSDPGAAARWLRDVASLEPTGTVPEPGSPLDPAHTWIEFRAGDSAIVVLGRADDTPSTNDPVSPQVRPWVFVDDLEAHHRRAVERGAAVLEPPHLHGALTYLVEDPEGVAWTFAQSSPRMRRAAARGVATSGQS